MAAGTVIVEGGVVRSGRITVEPQGISDRLDVGLERQKDDSELLTYLTRRSGLPLNLGEDWR